jgi:AraC-like DNA-binding protein
MEHLHRFALNDSQPISAEVYDYPRGFVLEEHSHDVSQLVHAIAGTMRVTTRRGVLVVPPQRAVWLTAKELHSVEMLSPVSMRTVYIAPSLPGEIPRESCVVSVSPLLRHLILAAIDLPSDYQLQGRAAAIVTLILDEIRRVDQIALTLNDPVDRRLLKIVCAIKANPADGQPLAHWARETNASERTIARLFLKETGLTFAQWRQQYRLIAAIGMLASGTPVTTVAIDLGYATPSAFGVMFRRALGVSARSYFGFHDPQH